MNQTLERDRQDDLLSHGLWTLILYEQRQRVAHRSSAEISDLFPDELVISEIGEIPNGWTLSTFKLADIQNGYAFKSKDWCEEGVLLLG